jgi:hypothetical protein
MRYVTAGVWLLGCLVGIVAMALHMTVPGLPIRASIALAPEPGAKGKVLWMFVHPQCQCTRASLDELESVLAQRRNGVTITIAYYCPANRPDSWAMGGLWSQAKEILGANRLIDRDGKLCRRFGARTSGQTLLFDRPTGSLLFAGGLTQARAMTGDSDGASAVRSWLSGHPSSTTAPVYGCALLGD